MVLPGVDLARREAIANPLTPPAQPNPKTGTPLNIGAEAEDGGRPGFQAGRRDTGRGHGDHAVDVTGGKSGRPQRPGRDLYEQPLGGPEIGLHALGPALGPQIPVERTGGVALADAGRGEHRRQPREIAKAGGKYRLCRGDRVGLRQNVFRNGRCDGKQFWQFGQAVVSL